MMDSRESDSWPEAEAFVERLNIQIDGNLFNPWSQHCDSFDISSCAPQIRRRHLLDYFKARRYTARYLFIGEALSFDGGRFSGIAMTSERMLNNQQTGVIRACQIIPGLDPQHGASWRTSKPEACLKIKERNHGRIEKTATVVWRVVTQDLCLDPLEFVLWNAVPWHPYKLPDRQRAISRNNIPKNRTPLLHEREIGREKLRCFLMLFPNTTAISIGEVAELELYRALYPNISYIPHPVRGMEEAFRTKILERFAILRKNSRA